jgi:hypothetical protein
MKATGQGIQKTLDGEYWSVSILRICQCKQNPHQINRRGFCVLEPAWGEEEVKTTRLTGREGRYMLELFFGLVKEFAEIDLLPLD